jgi:hypothetical protein
VNYGGGITQQVIIVKDQNKNKCPTQTETITLTGKLNPKGIRILADLDPCKIKDGSVTLNIPNSRNIKLAVMFIDKSGNKHNGALINPVKVQNLNNNQGLFKIDLDQTMNGINPKTAKSSTLTQINGLALYNNGKNPVQLQSGNTAALTTVLTK